jgi:hypothetical protein
METGGGDFELCPAGTHLATCYIVADIGHQEGAYGIKPKVVLVWELPNEKMQDGRPFAISQIYTASLSEKANLRHDLEAWRGRPFSKDELAGFDLKNVLGKSCTLTVTHSTKGDRTYANIASIGGVMKGMQVPALTNEPILFDMDAFDNAVLQALPKWIQTKIENAVTPAAKKAAPAHAGDDFDDDVNF